MSGKRGFAAMDPEKQRAIASKGGRVAHEKGKAHEYSPEEAREAGKKGGAASAAARRKKGNQPLGQALDENGFGTSS